MPDEAVRRIVRRPRVTPERESELLMVALDALREVGYGALSMDLIASRGHCSKNTLYRQWRNKAGMMVAAVSLLRPVASDCIDTGTLRGDLLSRLQQLVAGPDQDTMVIAALHHALLTDADLAEAFRTSLLEPEEEGLKRVIERAVTRGELSSRPAATRFLPHLMLSAIVARPLFEGVTADTDYLVRFVDDVLLPALQHS
ncbi:TetR/AcrR family transcriptional regulator [Streptomyces sp. NPDC058683]|uniref:TetR/AcrR family transcriptional regulator n=1 Tax=Streptomyces sp. NPDC058683 TaxID=3346597 RepID=UPI003660F75E